MKRTISSLHLLVPALALTTTLHAAPFAYVPHISQDELSVVDVATDQVIETIPASNAPTYGAADPSRNRVYVSHQGTSPGQTGGVAIIDTLTNQVIETLDLGSGLNDAAGDLALHPSGNPLYVTGVPAGNISVIDTVTNTFVTSITLPSSSGDVVFAPGGDVAYATGQEIAIIDTASQMPTGSISTGGSFLALHPSGNPLYVTDGNAVTVVDTVLQTVTGTITVGSLPFDMALRADGGQLYVGNTLGNSISAIDTASQMVVENIPVTGTINGLVEHQGILYVTATFDLVLIDTATNTILRGITLPNPGTDVVVWDRPRMFADGFESGDLSAWSATVPESMARP